MAKRNRTTNPQVIHRRIREGRGQRTGSDYQPWLRVQDVPSRGLSHRIRGWKTEREHHCLSNLELNYFWLLEWAPQVSDIREQYPLLPQDETLSIAQRLGVRHPTDPKTKDPIVMTTDFVVTVRQGLMTVDYARALKCTADLQSPRVLEKLEIERQFWQARAIPWAIVTERDIPLILAKNVKLLHDYLDISDRVALSAEDIQEVEKALAIQVKEISLREATALCDKKFGYDRGTCLTVAYHLLANRRWLLDMNIPIEPGKKLVFEKASQS